MNKIRVSPKMLEILTTIDRFDSESWADVWSHCSELFRRLSDFDRSADATIRHGLVILGDRLELTERGRLALRLDHAGILAVAS